MIAEMEDTSMMHHGGDPMKRYGWTYWQWLCHVAAVAVVAALIHGM